MRCDATPCDTKKKGGKKKEKKSRTFFKITILYDTIRCDAMRTLQTGEPFLRNHCFGDAFTDLVPVSRQISADSHPSLFLSMRASACCGSICVHSACGRFAIGNSKKKEKKKETGWVRCLAFSSSKQATHHSRQKYKDRRGVSIKSKRSRHFHP